MRTSSLFGLSLVSGLVASLFGLAVLDTAFDRSNPIHDQGVAQVAYDLGFKNGDETGQCKVVRLLFVNFPEKFDNPKGRSIDASCAKTIAKHNGTTETVKLK